MKDLQDNMHQRLQYKQSYFDQKESPCNGIENVSIIVHKKKVKNRKKYLSSKHGQHPAVALRLSRSGTLKTRKLVKKHSSMPDIHNRPKLLKQRTKSSHVISWGQKHNLNTKYVVNRVSEYHFNNYVSPFNYPHQKKWKVYRCQLSTKEESCCCSCNSDAMFEVMKSLYDCYKKKNCDDCNCILCGHLPREERRLGKLRKSLADVGLAGSEKERKEKRKKAEKQLEGKSKAEKEKILKELAKSGQPLPKGKTASEKELIKKVRTELGLPPKPKTAAEKEKMRKAEAAGLITPLEGKTTAQKEKILKAQAELGIELPEGRTASERALIQKIKTSAGIPPGVASEKLRKAKEAGLLTPLEGKSADKKEKILRGLAMQGLPLPEGKTPSERKIIEKVRFDLGLPPEPTSPSMKEKYAKAANAGLMQPLEGKSQKEKEKILQGLAELGIPLPEGRTPSERALIAKVAAKAEAPLEYVAPSEKIRRAKAAGLTTPIEGKSPEQKEKILKGLAMQGILLPEGKTASEKRLIDKVRLDLGLPPEPKTTAMKARYAKAADAGLLQPLEGKTPKEKERILQGLHDLGIPLPEGRTASEKSLIARVKSRAPEPAAPAPSEKLKKAKAAGFLTPLDGKTADQQEKILKGLAMQGIPLPEGKTASQRKIIDKVRNQLGLPPEPKNKAMRDRHNRAADAGLLQPLEGKTAKEKEKILQGLYDMGIPLPAGRTKSEKALVAKIKAGPKPPELLAPSEKLRKAKAAGLLTPLEGKPPEQKEKILRGLAMQGILLPEGKTPSEKKIIDKVRVDLGLPPEPKTPIMRERYARAADAGILQPLEGKTTNEKEKILQGLYDMGIPLPEGRTPSEKSLIARIKEKAKPPSGLPPSEKMRKAKAAGLVTPLEGKTPEEKEKILRGIAMQGAPLPEGKTASEKILVDKVRQDLGLPPEPKSRSMREKYKKAADAGFMQPLEGKSAKEKDKILRGLHDMGIPLPEGRTKSEKALIAKIQATPPAPPELTPLKKRKLDEKTAKVMKEGKGPADECICGILTPESEKETGPMRVPSDKMRKAKAAGLLTPLEGKTPEQREKILRGLAMQGIPLPEGKSASEKRIIDKVRADLGLPPEPKTQSMRGKYAKAADAGYLQPLEGKSQKEKEKILHGLHNMGIPLPVGRTASEKALIAKIQAESRHPSAEPSAEKLRKAKAAGLLTPLTGKSPAQREKILRGLAMQGVPLPEAKTTSEKMLIDKVRVDLGLPPEPTTPSMKERYNKAADAGLLQPLEGKSHKEKERILQGLQDMGIPLPEGRTASEKALIAKIKTASGAPAVVAPSEKLRRAKAAGLLTPLEGKTPAQKEKILRGLAMQGLPLPEGKTASEKKLVDKVRVDLGLPPEPKTPSMKEKYEQAANAGLLQPLEGKTHGEKEKILQGLHNMGIPLPEGRTASEKALIAKVKTGPRPSTMLVPSEKLRKAQAAGLITPLEGKTPAQREKILRGLAMQGIPLPEGKTASEKKIVDKVRADLGLPPSPKTAAEREKYNKAVAAGLITPLEGKTHKEKEKILRDQHKLGLPLPKGRTASEKALIKDIKRGKVTTRTIGVGAPALPPVKRRKLDEKTAKVMKEGTGPADECICGLLTPESERETGPMRVPSEKMRAAKAAGLLTPLEGKSPEQKEKILRGLALQGMPLPEAKTASDKKIIDKVRADLGLPPEPRTSSMKQRYAKAQADGIITPLEGKSAAQKEKILRAQAERGIPLPEGRTASEKALIAKIKSTMAPSITTEKLKKAKAAGYLTPLEGKSAAQKEKILRGLAAEGLPLPEGRTASEKMLIKKIKKELGVPERTPSEKVRRAKLAGLLTPLEGKTLPQKEKILRGRAAAGLPLPEGKTPSERALVEKIRKDTGYITPTPSERMRRAKAAGLLTPLEGKTTAEKEQILRDRLAAGIPIPEGKTPSEKEIIRKITAEAPPVARASERLRKAKAAGVVTPLEGKSKKQKEKIIRGLVKAGVPLPEPKTASEKNLMDKIRREVGLPPEPKTPSLREKYRKAHEAGIITPLEGKSKAEKEKVLRRLHDAGIPLPEGRTSSEKALIKRIKAELPERKVPSEKMKAARAAGLLTPLEGKNAAEKEKIIRGLAQAGIPLPEAKTASEKAIIQKVRADLGLPPEPATASEKEKMRKAQAQGIITPLEGKTSAQKEQILKNLAEAGIPLPEGRTASEKALIAKVKAETKLEPAKVTSEKMKQAKAAGLLTPLTGKSAKEKEKIMRGLVAQGLPLPETHTASERKIAEKIRAEVGLPPEPKTSSERVKLRNAEAAGKVIPLEGKTRSQKEKILRDLADAGVELPVGRTKSEKALIKKIKAELPQPPPPPLPPKERRKLDVKTAKVMKEGKGPSDECICGLLTPESERSEPTKAPTKTPSEKLRKAKATGLLTPLEGKSAAEKERILRGLAKAGIPLPEAKTTSERKLAYKIRKELGLPPEPKTASMKERQEKAAAAGVLVPLEGLSPAEKERVLKAQADLGLELPEGRTASERALIAKVKAESKLPPSRIGSERLQKAKAAGLLTPLLGKSAAEKERILRGLANQGIPLPIAHTSSERKIADKIRKELGLPPEPKTASMEEKHKKAAAAGVLVPLEGLSPAEKERVLKAQAELGIPLPEGRTASEKALIARIKDESKLPPSRIASEKMRKAKTAGLLTPLKGKKAAEKERIMRGLAKEGLPLPETKTSSERKLAEKIRKELGLPPEPKTAEMRQKHEKAAAAGLLLPLEGLTPAEKERVLRGQAEMGIPLPEGRTPSEKSLIAKIKSEIEPSLIPDKKLKKAKAAGLLTPLEGKTHAQKEKIIRKLAEAGLPLPEGKTASEKALIHKVRTELGIPPPATTASERAVVRKAKADGLLTPIAGKSAKEKERILKGLADAGLPMPEGKTTSEKELIKKIRTAAGLAPEATPSEKRGQIKTKSKRVGVTTTKKVAKGIGEGGITEEYEDILKTTTCDRGCGCDKKKIRFKHSYVKIRVTSPDISSLCPCPEECIPGVKAGAFIDNEGIKVTVGRVDGVTSYTSQFSNHILEGSKHIITLYDKILSNRHSSNSSNDTASTLLHNNIVPNDLQQTTDDAAPSQGCLDNKNKMNHGQLYSSSSYSSDSYDSQTSYKSYNKESHRNAVRNSNDRWIDDSDRFLDDTEYLETLGEIYRRPMLMSYTSDDTVTENSSQGSSESIIVIKSESSLSLSTASSVDVISVISFSNSSSLSDSTHYLYCPASGGDCSDSTVEELECFTNRVDYSAADTVTSQSNNLVTKGRRDEPCTNVKVNSIETASAIKRHNEYLTFRMSQSKYNHEMHMTKRSTRMTSTNEPVIVINDLNSEHDITKMVDQLLSKNEFSNASSIFVLVPTSDDNDSEHSIGSVNSTICIQVSEHNNWNRNKSGVQAITVSPPQNKVSATRGLKISSNGKKFFTEGIRNTSSVHNNETLIEGSKDYEYGHTRHRGRLNEEPIRELLAHRYNVASTDTTADRPCCCAPKIRKDAVQNLNSNHRCVANVVSELITPLLVNQGLGCDPYRQMAKLSMNQQASFVSINRPPTPVGACQVPSCVHPSGCNHEADMFQIPYGTPMPPPQPESKSQPCQCSPEKLQEMLDRAVKAGKGLNLKSTGCGGAPPKSSHDTAPKCPPVPKPKCPPSPQPKCPPVPQPKCPPSPQPKCPPSPKPKCPPSPQPKCPPSPQPKCPPIPQPTPLPALQPISTEPEGDCPACSHPIHTDECSCSGKKKRIKIKASCPCEQIQPPVSKTGPGPKAGTRSLGCQCCVCEGSQGECTKKFLGKLGRKSTAKASDMGHLEVLGPAGGMAQIEKDGTYTQAGRRDIPTRSDTTITSSTSTKKNCSCKKRSKKKNKNIICECPAPEPEPEPLEASMISPLDFSYEELKKFQLYEQKLAMKQRSDMTQTQSGFRMFKKKKPPPIPEPEFTVEDAVRYYATMNPDILKDLCPPPPDFRESDDCDCEDKKSKQNVADCDCPYVEPPPPPEPPKEEEGPFRGLKITMGGRGSGSKGLSGVCCFDVVEELNISKRSYER